MVCGRGAWSDEARSGHVPGNPQEAWKTDGFTVLEAKADAVHGPRNTMIMGVMQMRASWFRATVQAKTFIKVNFLCDSRLFRQNWA